MLFFLSTKPNEKSFDISSLTGKNVQKFKPCPSTEDITIYSVFKLNSTFCTQNPSVAYFTTLYYQLRITSEDVLVCGS